jgi:hypothetical protein
MAKKNQNKVHYLIKFLFILRFKFFCSKYTLINAIIIKQFYFIV